MVEITEDCFFFYNKEGQYLYGCSYLPQANASDVGVVIVPPVGHERLRCYRECVSLARELAKNGYPVLRFDYRGEGESDGIFEESDVSSRLNDLTCSVAQLLHISGIKNVCLTGFRLGAVLSMMAASQLNIDRLVLCDPIVSTEAYVKNLIRTNIIMQRDYFGNISKKEEDLWKDLDDGKAISLYGYHASNSFFKELLNIDILGLSERFTGNCLILYFAKRQATANTKIKALEERLNRTGRCHSQCIVTKFSWMTKKVWEPSWPAMGTTIAGWLGKNEK